MLLPNRCRQGPILARVFWFVVWETWRYLAAALGTIIAFGGITIIGADMGAAEMFAGLAIVGLGYCFIHLVASHDRELAEESGLEYDTESWL